MDYSAFEYSGEFAVYSGTIAGVAARAIRAGVAWLLRKDGTTSTAPRIGNIGD